MFLNIEVALSFDCIVSPLSIESPNSLETFFCKVDPRDTYLYTDPGDIYVDPYVPLYPGKATSLNLTNLTNDQGVHLEAGDFLSLEAVGDFRYGQSFFTETGTMMLGVFAGSGGALIPPGPETTANGATTSPTNYYNIPTDIPFDFLIPQDQAVLVEVPEGATQLLFSAGDSNFANNIDLDGDFKVWVKVTIIRLKFKKIVVENQVGNPNLNADFITMKPSVDTGLPECRIIQKNPSKQKIMLKCFSAGKVPSSECEVKFELSPGTENGGHDAHTHLATRPLGHLHETDDSKIVENQTYAIPKDGLAIIYTAPEVSGTVVLRFEVKDKAYGTIIKAKPTIFRIKVQGDFQKIQLSNLKFVNMNSHADGYYGLPMTISKLDIMLARYKELAIAYGVPENAIIPIRSEAASLAWGGLYDIGRNWNESHCGHRDGKTLDISMSYFLNSQYDLKLRKALADAARSKGFDFYKNESPEKFIDHWHMYWIN
jgi:hypothetical protein